MDDILEKLIGEFARFPGVGPRQARRFAYYLLTREESRFASFADILTKARGMVSYCASCGRLSVKSKKALCALCADDSRDRALLMVVAHDVDVESVEKSGSFKGYYFVLGGTIPILDEKPEERIRLKELIRRLSTKSEKGITEVILALDLNPEGEHTSEYLQTALAPVIGQQDIKITLLGRGLSTGTELQYSDPDTIKNALKNRAGV